MGIIKQRLRSCFISAPVGTDTSDVQHALEMRGVVWTDAFDAPIGGSLLATIDKAISNADFVCVVLAKEKANANVAFEMGVARGLRKPVFIVAEDFTLVPFSAQELSVVEAKLTDVDAIGFQLDAFLKYGDRSERAPSTIRRKPGPSPTVSWAEREIKALTNLHPVQRSREFERIVARLFEEAGGMVTLNRGTDQGADMVVWLDALHPSIGNPVVVEGKIGSLSEQRLSEAENQVATYFDKVRARAGIVVYHDLRGRTFESREKRWPLLFRFEVGELARLVRRGELPDEIIRQRNRKVHGRP